MKDETRKITMDDLTIQALPVETLIPAENNHKRHTEESTAKLAKSMADIGQIQPVVIDKDNEIIAGHGRWMAAQKLGWKKIKVIQLPLDRATAIKARIADNLMSNQDIDQKKLVTEINELKGMDLDFDFDSIILDEGLQKLTETNLAGDFGLDEEEISTDIAASVEQFTEENEEILKNADQAKVPVRNALGFNDITPGQARQVRDFMAVVIDETGVENPAEAFVQWIGDYIG